MSEEKFFPCKCCRIHYDWNYCPICGIPKPPEPKKLSQILFEAFQSQIKNHAYESRMMKWENVTSDLIKRGSQAQAEAAVKLVKELSEDANSQPDFIEKLEKIL